MTGPILDSIRRERVCFEFGVKYVSYQSVLENTVIRYRVHNFARSDGRIRAVLFSFLFYEVTNDIFYIYTNTVIEDSLDSLYIYICIFFLIIYTFIHFPSQAADEFRIISLLLKSASYTVILAVIHWNFGLVAEPQP